MARPAAPTTAPDAAAAAPPLDGEGAAVAAPALDCLHLDPDTRADAALRLKSARGHLDGIVRMLEDPDVYCVDVLKQVKAVQGALSRVNGKVLRAHVRDHVATASERGDTDAVVDELMEALKYRA